MKIIYHDPEGDVTYTRIARVDFSPEVDIKLNSLPVDTFTADIITPDTLERGWLISLKNDVDTLFAKFKITKVQRINKDTLRVEAVSPLWLMDWWTVGAERIQTTAGAAVYDLFNGLPKSGYLSIIPYTLPTDLANININGFAPEQTARERLLWLCLAMGAWVQQSFCNGLVFHALPNFSNHDLTQGTLIPYKRTYWKPSTQLGDPVYVVWVELVGNISTDETTGTQSGTDENGTTYYWNLITHGYTNPDENAPGGSEVKISGVSLLNNEYQQPTFSLIGALYQNRMEVSAEVIDNGDIQPGDVVRVYTDEDLIYCGVVQQCTFTFGQQAKARLTVNAYPDELPIQIVRVSFTSGDVPLGQETEVYPEGDTWEVDAPTIDGYTPTTPSITGSTGGNYSIDYTKIPLKYIWAINGSFTQYLEGKNISYANLLVLGYQTEKTAAIQVKWTNGGQWPDGRIPFEALTLPVTKAVYDPTTPSQEYPGASIQTIPVQYIDNGGTVFEDTFNVVVYPSSPASIPASIRVITPPTKTTYEDGETIDFTGIEVKAYTEDGEEVESIPFEELIFPVTVADLDEAEADRWSDGSGVNAMLIAYTQKWFVDWRGQNVQVYTSQILGEYGGKPFMWGGNTGHSQPTTFFATNYNGTVYIWASTASQPMNGWVYNEGAAQYQYQMVSGTSATTGTGEVIGAGLYDEHVKNIPESAKMPNGTEEMHAEAAKQKIPVQWVRQEDGKVLETYYEITVEGFTPE